MVLLLVFVGTRGIADLVSALIWSSEEFGRLWSRRDVRVNGHRHGHKRLLHPQAGPLTVEFEVPAPLRDSHQRLVIYRAADPASPTALDAITAITHAEPVQPMLGSACADRLAPS